MIWDHESVWSINANYRPTHVTPHSVATCMALYLDSRGYGQFRTSQLCYLAENVPLAASGRRSAPAQQHFNWPRDVVPQLGRLFLHSSNCSKVLNERCVQSTFPRTRGCSYFTYVNSSTRRTNADSRYSNCACDRLPSPFQRLAVERQTSTSPKL